MADLQPLIFRCDAEEAQKNWLVLFHMNCLYPKTCKEFVADMQEVLRKYINEGEITCK